MDLSIDINEISMLIKKLLQNFKLNEKEYLPISAMLINKNKKILKIYENKNALEHCEIRLIKWAIKKKINLRETAIIVLIEPCPMCFYAIQNCKIPYVFFGSYNQYTGACGGKIMLAKQMPYCYSPLIIGGFMDDEISNYMKSFFKENIR